MICILFLRVLYSQNKIIICAQDTIYMNNNRFQIIKQTGFLDGLFTEEELNSDNIKDKEAKLAFLTKLIDVVSK